MHIEQNTRKLKVKFKSNLRKNPSENFLINILNNDSVNEEIKFIKKSVKKVTGKSIRIRGRHHDRKGLFAQFGLIWTPMQRNSNDIPKSLWKYCDHFSIYMKG